MESDLAPLTQPARPPRVRAVEWLALVAGAVLLLRYAWVMDDAFVFYRYADNALFLGNGLVYNAGERVEGFSSPLWMLLLLVLRAPGWDYWILVRVVGLLVWSATWWGLCRLDRALSPHGAPVVNLPLAYLATNYGFLCYFTSGIETPLVQLAAVLYALQAVRPRSRWLQLLLALTPLVRHELALALVTSWALTWWRTRRVPLVLTLAAVLVNGAWLVFRIATYADLVPNTFYLKDRTDFAQGLRYLWDILGTYQVLPFALLVAWLAWRARAVAPPLGARRARLCMLALALPIAFYAVRIGGDARHYRYLAFPFVLLVAASGGYAERAALASGPRGRRALAVLPYGLLLAVFLFRPPQLGGHPAFGPVAHTQRSGINDAEFHRDHEDIALDAFMGVDPRDPLPRYGEFVAAGSGYRGIFTNGRCVQIWRGFDLRWIHWHGLTDAVLARVDMPPERPGHKPGLRPLAADLSAIYIAEHVPGLGMYRRAVERGEAPAWVSANLDVLERIEARLYGERGFGESLQLAFSRVGRVHIPD